MKNWFSPSIVTSFFLIVILFIFRYLTPGWTSILSWDIMGYYLYLPSYFIHHDLGLKDMTFLHQIMEQYHPTDTLYQVSQIEGGQWVMKYTMGFAILYTPFFFLGHLAATIFGYALDGFSAPYQYAILLGAFVYSALGLVILRRVLRFFFDEIVTSIVLVLIALGTNYFENIVMQGPMPHNALFTLYAALLYFTIQWHAQYKLKFAIGIGLIAGLITLYRPSEMVCVIIPLLWGVYNKNSFRLKLEKVKQYKTHLIFLVFFMILMGSFQMLYWKSITGHFLYDSYDNPGEGFEFLHPFPLKVLFSFKKGWLVYAPMMTFALLGFYFLYKEKKELFFAIACYFTISFYIICSWTCWWYATSLGQRSLMESYAVLAIPFGYFIVFIRHQSNYLKSLFYLICSFFIVLNIFQTWQLSIGLLDGSRMTAKYYFAIFGKTETKEGDRELLEVERSTTGIEVLKDSASFTKRNLCFFDFEDCPEGHCSLEIVHSGKLALVMDSTNLFSKSFSISYSQLTDKEYAWIRATVYVYPTVDLNENPTSLILTFQYKGKNYKYQGCDFEKLSGIKLNQWNRISVDYMTPIVRTQKDKLQVYIWHRGKQRIIIDDLNVELYEPKE